jgi:hypothetical protein
MLMHRRALVLIPLLIFMGLVVMAQGNTPTPPTGPIPIVSETAMPTTSPQATAIISTPTLIPANGESAQISGPISVIDNIHAAVAPFTSVLENPTLSGDVLPILVNGRTIEVPHGWSYTGQAGIGGLPPHIQRYDGQGLRFGWDYVNGQAGFAQDGIQLFANQRYVVRVNYRTDIIYTLDSTPFTPSHLQVAARLYTAQGGFTELPAQSMRGTQEQHTIEWVIESSQNPYPFVRLEVTLALEYPIFIGGTFLESIDILTAPTDYRPQFVIDFE